VRLAFCVGLILSGNLSRGITMLISFHGWIRLVDHSGACLCACRNRRGVGLTAHKQTKGSCESGRIGYFSSFFELRRYPIV